MYTKKPQITSLLIPLREGRGVVMWVAERCGWIGESVRSIYLMHLGSFVSVVHHSSFFFFFLLGHVGHVGVEGFVLIG